LFDKKNSRFGRKYGVFCARLTLFDLVWAQKRVFLCPVAAFNGIREQNGRFLRPLPADRGCRDNDEGRIERGRESG
jgi:hypothetical protein